MGSRYCHECIAQRAGCFWVSKPAAITSVSEMAAEAPPVTLRLLASTEISLI